MGCCGGKKLTSWRKRTFNISFLSICRSNQVLTSVWEISSWCWPGSATEGGLSASRGCFRRFLLLKLVTVLLFSHSAGLPLLVSCVFSLRVLLLLRSPLISTKPSTVLLGQLAFTDTLVLLRWMLQMGGMLARWMEEVFSNIEMDPLKETRSIRWREAVGVLCQLLLDAHHLASLLLLGLLGLEATMVLRWPQKTQRFRTSHWAWLSCSLMRILVLLELMFALRLKLLPFSYPSAMLNPQTSLLDLMPSLPAFSSFLRRTLWLVNLWLHYVVLNSKPQRRQSSFH